MNVDISDKVIDQMNQLYSKTHPDMKFMTMDLLNLEFSPGSYSCFLDKGTLDALMSENSDESRKRAVTMFEVTLIYVLEKWECFHKLILSSGS